MLGKILIVDDNTDALESLAKLLELESFTVITAADGITGLIKARTEHPDLVLTDISMPNLDGIEMIRLLRQYPEFQETPIVTVTAFGASIADDAIVAGADLAIAKPVEIDLLIDEIKQLLYQHKCAVGVI